MYWKTKSQSSCGDLLKCIATSQVFIYVLMQDLRFRNRILNSVLVEPKYWRWHLQQEARWTTFLEEQESLDLIMFLLFFNFGMF